ncbi:WAT1-related protein At3g28050-like [Chenopodium quinoa]|uniref:WAT1-related protein At3g28050-like n=1 Tax=Chenopodium quinoa TaxID=63459 RepID=UPI000B77AE5D|nr:WAT1-related protein At3g28050-like [Chenopodium quinoa]
MEILNLSTQSSILKLVGTIVSISGTLVVILYQGLPIILFSSPIKASFHILVEHHQAQPNWIVGGIFLSMSSIVISLAYVTKTWIARDFPSEVLIILITFFFETIVATIATSIAENDASVWKPTIGIQWISILFGAVAASLVNIVDTWACRVKGPVFVAMFKPLQMIIAVIMGVSLLGDVLHLGSVIGGLIIAFGFYTVMKGNAEEEMLNKDDENRLAYIIDDVEESHPLKIPMLYDKSMDA